MNPVRILQLTDLHLFAQPEMQLKGIPTRESLQEVVHFIQANEAPFDHVIVTGDHTHDEMQASYEAAKQILGSLSGQLWQIPGNHDDRTLLRHVFPRPFCGSEADRIHFIVECGDWALIGLDSHVPGAVAGEFDAAQAEWLQQQISQSAAKRIALFIHHPPVDVGSVWMDAIGLGQRERLQQIVEADPRVTLICCGHVHHEFQTTLHQALVCTTPSTGIQFSPQGHEATFAAEPPGYRVIELRGTEYATHVVRLPQARWVPVAE